MTRKQIEKTNGKFFRVVFTKKNGERRHMVARTGVKSYLRGGSSRVSHLPHLMTVFDVQKLEYRNINLDTVSDFKCG
jgi:hypothetical protein